MTKELEAWQKRVVEERDELNTRCTKLFHFLRSEKCPVGEPRELLAMQLDAMIRYRTILELRIEAF